MAHHDHVIGPLGAGGVNRLLHGAVERLSGLVLHEAVDEVSVVIHEVPGRGGEQGVGSGDADKSDLYTADLLHDPRLQEQLALLVEVAADVGEVCLPLKLQEAVHTVVKLVVARNRRVVAHGVHDVDDGLAAGQGADGLALDGVAVVDEQDIILFGEVFPHGIQARVAPALVDAAVHVAGIEDDDVLLVSVREGARRNAGEERSEETDRENQRQCFFHAVSPVLFPSMLLTFLENVAN